jgi:protocatechuate 3,4-dioxygenase beta subunit
VVRIFSFLVLAAAIPLQTPPRATSTTTGTASISGVVVDAADQSAVARARVELNNGQRVTYTNANGEFEFPKLNAGAYQLGAQASGYLGAVAGQKRPGQSGVAQLLSDGQSLKGVKLALHRPGVISGRVLNERGRPMPDVTVRTLALRWRADGGREFESGRGTVTDDRGEYRLSGLLPGTYAIVAIPNLVSGVSARERAVELDVVQPLAADGYVPTYFPGVTEPRAAATIAIAADSERAAVDFQLPQVPFARVRGRVQGVNLGPPGPSGRPDTGVVLLRPPDRIGDASISSGNEREQVAAVLPDGRFVFEVVPPGDYELIYRQGSGAGRGDNAFALMPVSITGHDLSDIVVDARPGVTISGDQSPDRISAGSFFATIVLTPVSGVLGPHNGPIIGKTDAQGAFTMTGVPPGRYQVGALTMPPNAYISSVTIGKTPATGTLIDVGGSNLGDVHVAFNTPRAEVSGIIRRDDFTPVTDYTLIVFPEDRKEWPSWMTGASAVRPNSSGRYSQSLKPGTYLIAAVEEVAYSQWMDPAFLETLIPSATRIILIGGQPLAQDFVIKR